MNPRRSPAAGTAAMLVFLCNHIIINTRKFRALGDNYN